jgi:hypothetical protein
MAGGNPKSRSSPALGGRAGGFRPASHRIPSARRSVLTEGVFVSIPAPCPACQSPVPTGARFCPGCASPVVGDPTILDRGVRTQTLYPQGASGPPPFFWPALALVVTAGCVLLWLSPPMEPAPATPQGTVFPAPPLPPDDRPLAFRSTQPYRQPRPRPRPDYVARAVLRAKREPIPAPIPLSAPAPAVDSGMPPPTYNLVAPPRSQADTVSVAPKGGGSAPDAGPGAMLPCGHLSVRMSSGFGGGGGLHHICAYGHAYRWIAGTWISEQ